MSWKDQLAEFNRYRVLDVVPCTFGTCTLFFSHMCHFSRRKLASCEEVAAKDTTPQMDEVSAIVRL